AAATRPRFDAHRAACTVCQLAFAEAEAGKHWLAELTAAEPPRMLLHNILAATTGARRAEAAAVAGRLGWRERANAWMGRHVRPVLHPMLQPRFAMSAAMAFFSLSIVFNLGWRDRKSTRLNSSHSQISY